MHVVQVLVSLDLGGSELVAVELAEFAAARGHKVTVIAADGPLRERVENAGACHLDWAIGRKRLATLRFIGRLRRWVREERPDVLHVHSRLPAWICRLALRKLPREERPAVVSSVHGRYSVNRYSAIMVRADRVICVSEFIRDYTLNHYDEADPEKLEVIHGGVSRTAFPTGYKPPADWFEAIWKSFPEVQGRRLLCMPGRLSRYKGHQDFIGLIAALNHREPEVHGVVVGKARQGSRFFRQLQDRSRNEGIQDRITFVGARTDIRDWMAASEIVYNLSADPPEAFGRTVPEALFLGVPVIAWDHGGVHETLARLFPQGAVPPGDKELLVERSLEFLTSPPPVPPPEAFDLDQSMEATLQIYHSLAKNY